MNQSSCDGHALFLTAGESAALLAYRGVEAKGHVGEVPSEGAVLEGFLYLLLGKVLAQGDIFADRGVEKEHVLLDVAHLGL